MDEEKTETIEKIKKHFAKNKAVYISGGVCLIVGVAGTLIFKESEYASQKVQNFALFNWKPFNLLEQTTIVEVAARGHRGFAILNRNTGEVYGSVREAAKEIGCSRTVLREHLLGQRADVNGGLFENLGENLKERVTVPV